MFGFKYYIMSNSNILKIGSLLNKFPNKSSKVELSQELKDKLVSVVSAYGKSNSDKDRDIIKDKTGKGNDFQILNADYKLNSSFGKYEEDFTSWRIYLNIKVTDNVITTNGNFNSTWFIYKHSNENEINEMNIKVSGIPEGGIIRYFYIPDETATMPVSYNISEDGVYHLPKSKLSSNRVSVGFIVSSSYDWNNIRIEQIPLFKGAFTTDGIDDLIVSTKTIEEMGITDEVTVISMIHQIDNNKNNFITTNNFRTTNRVVGRNIVSNIEKTGIYGWYKENIQKEDINIINNILGDKNDYIAHSSPSTNTTPINSSKFYVTGYVVDENNYNELSSVAWYWTVIAKAVLTTDEINQVIAYYNLDRPGEIVKPDILYDVKRQGITNENHAEFNDELIDFSGNNYNLKLYNMLWDKQSGIGNYPISFKDYTYLPARGTVEINRDSFVITSNTSTANLLEVNTRSKVLPSYKVKIEGVSTIKEGNLKWKINTTAAVTTYIDIFEDGVYDIPATPKTEEAAYSGWCISKYNKTVNVKITLLAIDDITDAIVLDGINNFGKVSNIPILKDYTVAAFRKWLYGDSVTSTETGSIVSKSKVGNNGAFIFEQTLNRNPPRSSTFSFGTINSLMSNDKLFEESFTYQTKYSYNGNSIQPGTGVDSDSMWLGVIRDGDARFSKLALWSLMLFPYSLSEFLIERQLKKHKLGTLYPDMVEFRPVINSNVLLDAKPTFVIRGTNTYLNAGDYVPENSQIWVSIKMNNAADRITKFTVNGKTIDIPENAYSEVTLQYGFPFVIDKSPQKIGITIEQDENYVLFNPVINSNYDNYKLTFHLREYEKLINIGDYIPKGTYIRANLYLKNNIDELVTFTFNGVNIDYVKSSVSDLAYNIRQIYNYDSPQEVNITVDEYIRYEDIVQPYPVLLRFNDENGNEVSWGGKFRVGSTITRIGSIADPESNLLNGLYSVSGLSLNGKAVTSSTSIVEKQMVFKTTATYLLDNNEPKCILSPRLLRIPNSSYKITMRIPDISGHGNHGKINNSAYAGMSGANGYVENFNDWIISKPPMTVEKTDSQVRISYIGTSYKELPMFEYSGSVNEDYSLIVEVQGIPNNVIGKFIHNNGFVQEITNGINTIKFSNSGSWYGFTFYREDNSIIGDCDITIQQIGEYEGAYCLDGVDDFVTIPTLSSGGKQVLMKVNWNSYIGRGILYDQRGYLNEFAIYNRDLDSSDNHVFAYQARNNGQTYIDGILNNNIDVSELRNITHNITITNELSAGVNTSSPVIGSNRLHNDFFANMALYDFMLFDNISTDDKIKELNEYVGTEGNFVEWNPTITTNISSTYAITPNIRKSDGIIVKLVKGNIYSTSITGNLVLDIVPPNKDLDEVTNVIIDGKSYTPIKYQYTDYYRVEIPLIFPQEINVIIDEYIRYESIEQPYPIFLNYIDKETNKAYTWGDKVKVDSILKISGYKNLFENGDTSLGGSNGYSVNGSSELIALGTLLTSEILVNKINTGVKSSVIWNLNTPKPLFAYDPSIINNIGLKNLGYLPDVTGQGRHLLLNEFAYEGMSGINGYPVVFGENKTWEAQGTKDGDKYYIYTSSANKFNITQIKISSSLFYTYIKRNGELTSGNKDISSFKLKVTGLDYDKFYLAYYYLKSADVEVRNVINITSDGIYELPKSFASDGSLTETNSYIGLSFIRKSSEIPDVVGNVNVIIEILPNYEGALCFDGINDYGTVSNLSSQYIKTLLMKVNWMKDTPMLLYDQRGGSYFGILTTQESDINNTKIAYQARNPNGKTYIDGIENNYIETYTLKDITHNITITNSNVNTIVTPIIGSNSNHSTNFAQMAMYKVMGLPEIPSDEEIKILNNWAGIEAKVELPHYYWDAYGKTNLDADRGYIKDQVSLQLNNDNTNNNSLENFNFGYEGMSGYNGYPVVFGANKTWETLSSVYNYTSDVTSTTIHVTHVEHAGNGLLFSYVKRDGALANIKEIPALRVTVRGLEGNSKFGYRYLATEDATEETLVYLGNGTHELAKSFAPTDVLLNLNRNAWIGIFITPMVEGEVVFDCDITIEVLPEYENGLAYDGVSDFTYNKNIPILTDFTFIIKREILGLETNESMLVIKGDKVYNNGIGNAFILEHNNNGVNYVYSYGKLNQIKRDDSKIIYLTPESYNSNPIIKGENGDNLGLVLSRHWRGIIYKTILYSKTISLLEINFLKNLMEKNEIINLNNPIFIQK